MTLQRARPVFNNRCVCMLLLLLLWSCWWLVSFSSRNTFWSNVLPRVREPGLFPTSHGTCQTLCIFLHMYIYNHSTSCCMMCMCIYIHVYICIYVYSILETHIQHMYYSKGFCSYCFRFPAGGKPMQKTVLLRNAAKTDPFEQQTRNTG